MDEEFERKKELAESERLEHLRQAMYSRSLSPHLKTKPRHDIESVDYGVPKEWHEKEEEVPGTSVAPRVIAVTQRLMWWILGSAILFFVASTAIFFYYFTLGGGGTVASPGNIEISVRGPTSVVAGEKSEFEVVVTNHNQATLQLADLIMKYPDGTRSPTDFLTDMPQQRISLGSIEPGGQRQGTVAAVLMGKEGAHASSSLELEYRVANSNAIFIAKQEYTFTFANSPISITLDANNEAVSGQEMLITAHVTSNTDTTLKDVLFTMAYPFGFMPISLDPAPKYTNTWELGDLEPGVEHIITIRGTLDGQNGDERIFTASAGTRKDPRGKHIDAELSEAEHRVAIARPFIGLALSINKDSGTGDISVGPGQTINVSIPWINNLSTPITDAVIVARLTGLGIQQTSVRSPDGFYRSSDNSVLWDKDTSRGGLATLDPGEHGTLSFSFQMPPAASLVNAREAAIQIEIHAAGKRGAETGVPETLQATVSRTIKLASNSNLLASGLYYSNPFGSVGPLPPKVNQETTYAVVYTLQNTSNALKDVKVTALLPAYVRWIGVTSPAQERISFNTLDGTVVWDVGAVAQGTGVASSSPRQVAFSIGLTPSTSQIGQKPALIKNIILTGTDVFTGQAVVKTINDVDTNLINDQGFSALESNVVQ